ncbi:GcrA family cell cycle regulator [Pelagibacterium sediminicola]|uniref:GcrA family cell cycle regulator n=1 Tax=Pelagibacterium sediminicola TaxID=2248761 RepID=UPI000E30F68A|nr:GcrA family cell cycle regulator [Pelagibacterium sediminicola]
MRTRVEKHSWTKDRVSTLRELWLEGLSATEIGQRLGCTRNAVLGKVHRIGLSGRRTPVRKSIERRADRLSPKLAPRSNVPVRKRNKPGRAPVVKFTAPPVEPRHIPRDNYSDPLPGSNPVASIIDATGCKYAIGQHPHSWCNEDTVPGKSWCADHAAIVFQQNPKALKGAGTFKSLGEALQGALR